MYRWWIVSIAGCSVEARLDSACADYCAQLASCDSAIDESSCNVDCRETTANCQVDEVDQVVDELHACGDGACDEIGACTLGATLQCLFGV